MLDLGRIHQIVLAENRKMFLKVRKAKVCCFSLEYHLNEIEKNGFVRLKNTHQI